MTTSFPQNLTKNDYAYAQLRTLILTGQLKPGAPLQQGKLANDMGVSTTPLREAIRRLAAEGLVTLAAHRDARVSEVTQQEATDLYRIRLQLDPLAAELAAAERSEEELEGIIAAESQLRPLAAGDGLEALLAHREYHRRIYRASHNDTLIDMLERLWDKADRYRLIGLHHRGDSPADSDRVAREHHELVESIRAQDPPRARLAMEAHIRGSLGGDVTAEPLEIPEA
ncbi:GntR family transcriptional regulator [Corynebacterium sp. A21]|uniref:GntR family transcriptional regulator n=1 Tax=Corynebacterium sp. A21 TaxID=3457318 RepID=UPI003FD32E7C